MKLTGCLLAALLVLLTEVAGARPVMKTIRAAKPDYYEAVIRYHAFTDRTPLAQLANKTIESWAKRTLSWYVSTTGHVASIEKPPYPYSFSATSEVNYFAPLRLISVVIGTGEGGGGAPHPVHGFATFNFGVIDGMIKRLALSDVFRPGFTHRPLVSRLVMQKLREARARDAVEGRMSPLTPQELDKFVITRDGLTYWFMPGVLATYAEGPFEVTLQISELGPHFRRELLLGR